jgi:hypothetical protein
MTLKADLEAKLTDIILHGTEWNIDELHDPKSTAWPELRVKSEALDKSLSSIAEVLIKEIKGLKKNISEDENFINLSYKKGLMDAISEVIAMLEELKV